VAGGVLAEGFGPGAVAMAVIDFADESEFAGGADLFLETAKISAEFVVVRNAEIVVLEIAAKSEGELFFAWLGEIDGFHFPSEALAGLFGELGTHAGFVDAGALELRQAQERVKVGFDFGE